MEDKKDKLLPVCDAFDAAAAVYKIEAACHKGCAFCCRDAGSIDVTTLEGLAIRDQLAMLPRSRQTAIKKNMAADMRRRVQQKPSACPFLMKTAVA